MKFAIFAAPAAALCLATPGFAQDFSGIRGEVRAGWDRLEVEVDGEGDPTNGVAYGAEVGYDFAASPNLVIGAYAGLDFSTIGDCVEAFGNDEACVDADRNITAGVRVGGVVGRSALLYAKGGYSNGRFTASYEDFDGVIPSFAAADNAEGFHLGAGAEVGFGSNAYGKVEYVYTNYGDLALDFGFNAFTADANRHQVLVGFGFRI